MEITIRLDDYKLSATCGATTRTRIAFTKRGRIVAGFDLLALVCVVVGAAIEAEAARIERAKVPREAYVPGTVSPHEWPEFDENKLERMDDYAWCEAFAD